MLSGRCFSSFREGCPLEDTVRPSQAVETAGSDGHDSCSKGIQPMVDRTRAPSAVLRSRRTSLDLRPSLSVPVDGKPFRVRAEGAGIRDSRRTAVREVHMTVSRITLMLAMVCLIPSAAQGQGRGAQGGDHRNGGVSATVCS